MNLWSSAGTYGALIVSVRLEHPAHRSIHQHLDDPPFSGSVNLYHPFSWSLIHLPRLVTSRLQRLGTLYSAPPDPRKARPSIAITATGSAEELPPRIRANPRGYARTPPGSARIRRTSAKNIFRRTPPNVRRTPADSARIRADPRGLRGELAEEFTRKMSADKNLPNTTVPRGETSAADVLPPRKY